MFLNAIIMFASFPLFLWLCVLWLIWMLDFLERNMNYQQELNEDCDSQLQNDGTRGFSKDQLKGKLEWFEALNISRTSPAHWLWDRVFGVGPPWRVGEGLANTTVEYFAQLGICRNWQYNNYYSQATMLQCFTYRSQWPGSNGAIGTSYNIHVTWGTSSGQYQNYIENYGMPFRDVIIICHHSSVWFQLS